MVGNEHVIFVQGKRREGSDQAVFYMSFIAGIAAGGIASLSVNPFDGKLSLFNPPKAACVSLQLMTFYLYEFCYCIHYPVDIYFATIKEIEKVSLYYKYYITPIKKKVRKKS